jgi:hypothetical protein
MYCDKHGAILAPRDLNQPKVYQFKCPKCDIDKKNLINNLGENKIFNHDSNKRPIRFSNTLNPQG